MPTQVYYSSLTDLINAEAIPGDFEALEDTINSGLDLILKKIWYKDLVVDVSSTGEVKHYYLDLLAKKLNLPLFGSGMNLVFFRDATGTLSSFPIIFEWLWPIYKYIQEFEEEGFSYAPEAFVNILFELADIEDEKEFLGSIVSTFLNDGNNSYQSFFTAFTSKISSYNTSAPAVTTEINIIIAQLGFIETEVTYLLSKTNFFTAKSLFDGYEDNTILVTAVNAIKTSIENLSSNELVDIDLFNDIIQSLIGEVTDFKEKFARLEKLFKGYLTEINEEDFFDLLIPQFAIELHSINMGLEFPRNWLVPAIIDPDDASAYIEDPDETHLASLEFTVGDLKFSNKNGFNFENQFAFNFDPAFIGKTGIMLEFTDFKVDMSKSVNIPEADADGRPSEFQGLFCERAAVRLPARWFKNQTTGSTAEIFGENMLIGTGGVSGKLGLEAVGGNEILWANIGSDNGFKVGFIV